MSCMNKKGVFVTFEGIDGSGKTIQSKLLFEYLVNRNVDAILTREPGGTDGAEQIRELLLKGKVDKWHQTTEALLYLAARAEHWERKIKPALDNGKVVICDRFQDSSVVYQSICKGVDIELLDCVYKSITNNKQPDMTFLIDIEPEVGIKRSFSRENNETRFEHMNLNFHKKARESFLKLSESNTRFCAINGSLSIEQIHEIITKKFDMMFAV
ncbi:thymidylate kinase [Alphaproteobacteria bacterium]|nr:thymidylate kinase [Alphaproteobacteria bacterium]